MATPRFLRSFALPGAGALAPVLSCHAQTVKPSEVVKWDDYTFKFGPSAQMAQVLQGDGVVGSIIMMNGSLQVMPLPDADGEKLKKSFEDWKAFNARSHSGGGAAAGGPTEPSYLADYAPHYLDGSAWKPMTVVVSAKQPLPPGQYVLDGPPTIGVYDFGVTANKAN
jgi:hypothetical protein